MSCLFYACSKRAVIHVTGADAGEYLQSQFANDLTLLDAQPAVYGFWLDRKGRVRADSFISRDGGCGYWLTSYYMAGQALAEIVAANIIADDVEVVDRSAEFISLSFIGPDPEAYLGCAGFEPVGASPSRDLAETVIKHPGRHCRGDNFDVYLSAAGANGLGKAIREDGMTEVNTEQLHAMRIEAGIPAVPFELWNGDLPQDAGAEKDGVSFTKGCYLGQETMARLHAMGSVRRALYRVGGSGPVPQLPFNLLAGSAVVGEVRCAVPTGSGGWQALAILTMRKLDGHSILAIAGDSGQSVCFTPVSPLG